MLKSAADGTHSLIHSHRSVKGGYTHAISAAIELCASKRLVHSGLAKGLATLDRALFQVSELPLP